jgi:hypothetical protein
MSTHRITNFEAICAAIYSTDVESEQSSVGAPFSAAYIKTFSLSIITSNCTTIFATFTSTKWKTIASPNCAT